jgi:hypothetical protein
MKSEYGTADGTGECGYLWTDESFRNGERAAEATLGLDGGTGMLR